MGKKKVHTEAIKDSFEKTVLYNINRIISFTEITQQDIANVCGYGRENISRKISPKIKKKVPVVLSDIDAITSGVEVMPFLELTRGYRGLQAEASNSFSSSAMDAFPFLKFIIMAANEAVSTGKTIDLMNIEFQLDAGLKKTRVLIAEEKETIENPSQRTAASKKAQG